MRRILCVEDDEDGRELITFAISRAFPKHHIEGVASATRAAELIESLAYDLYVIDSRMPGMSGAELCRWIRGNGSTSPVIFFSAAMEIDKEKAFDAGANEYLIKPNDFYRL